MSLIIQPVPWGEKSWTPSDTAVIGETSGYQGYNFGFRVNGAGNVKFEYMDGNAFTRAYDAGDEVFGRIKLIYSTNTTATGITVFRFLE